MRILTDEQIKKINKSTIGQKYGCSGVYVGQVLRGDRENNTQLARNIIADAQKIIELLEPTNPQA